MIGLPFNTSKTSFKRQALNCSTSQDGVVKKWCSPWYLSHPTTFAISGWLFRFKSEIHPICRYLNASKFLTSENNFFSHQQYSSTKSDGFYRWSRLYHTLCLRSRLCTLLYYRYSDIRGLVNSSSRLRSTSVKVTMYFFFGISARVFWGYCF